MDILFLILFETSWKKWFVAIVGPGRNVRKSVAKKDRKGEARQLFWATIFEQKVDKQSIQQLIKKQSPKSIEFDAPGGGKMGSTFDQNRFNKSFKKQSLINMEFDAKGVPKWSQN